jgi:hypothetical protein
MKIEVHVGVLYGCYLIEWKRDLAWEVSAENMVLLAS